MTINWPTTPTLNQEITGPRGEIWKWDGAKWVSLGTALTPQTGMVRVFGGVLQYFDGTNWVAVPAATPPPVQLSFVIPGKPPAEQNYIVPMTIALSLTNSVQVYAITAPSAAAIFIVSKNGASIGTITIATNGTASSNITPTQLAIADVLQLTAPTTQDATLADLGITLLATRV